MYFLFHCSPTPEFDAFATTCLCFCAIADVLDYQRLVFVFGSRLCWSGSIEEGLEQILSKANVVLTVSIALGQMAKAPARASGDINKLKHVIIVMQENHSFDNYLGVLPYASGTPYHQGPCQMGDHNCVDGLNCTRSSETGAYSCENSNPAADGTPVTAFHSSDYCVTTDLDHPWTGVHEQGNFEDPNSGLLSSPNDGFVRVNDQINPDNETMSFYNESDLAFYYSLAMSFALDDRYFSSVLGPTFTNRAYLMSATSFGHLTTDEEVPLGTPIVVYKPLTAPFLTNWTFMAFRGGITFPTFHRESASAIF